jgi:transcriptional regulator with XRE-family HTH domain
MRTDSVDLTTLGERFAAVRRAYGESIDLPDLGRGAFAALLGVSVAAYESYERGEAAPTIGFLLALRNKTGFSLDCLPEAMDSDGSGSSDGDDGFKPNDCRASQVGSLW